MGKRQYALSALGFVQGMGLAGHAAAQDRLIFGDASCQLISEEPGNAQCVDVGCFDGISQRQCEVTPGMFQDDANGPDQQGLGCVCVDHSVPPIRCAPVHQEILGGPETQGLCADLDCGQTDPALHCDDSCECVPDPQVDPNRPTVEVFDHYKCYKVKSDQKHRGEVRLDALQAAFQVGDNCRVGKARKFCVPVMKKVTVVDPRSTMMPNPSFTGQDGEHVDDLICYKIKCELPRPPSQVVNDQFGVQTFVKMKAFELCTPAKKGLP